MAAVSTLAVLARKALERSCGQECVDWAIGMLERGFESPSLLLLAGMTPPLNHFELSRLRDLALEETRPPELAIADPVPAYFAEMLRDALDDPPALRRAFAWITSYAMSLGYPREYQQLCNVHHAAEELQRVEEQWYRMDATRENIEEIMRGEAQRFVAEHP